MKYRIEESLPKSIKPPLGFRERGGEIEGYISEPLEILRRFEPVDVLSGNIELVDQQGVLITIHSENDMPIEKNEYPKDNAGIYYIIHNE
jgi:hypothetical protein